MVLDLSDVGVQRACLGEGPWLSKDDLASAFYSGAALVGADGPLIAAQTESVWDQSRPGSKEGNSCVLPFLPLPCETHCPFPDAACLSVPPVCPGRRDEGGGATRRQEREGDAGARSWRSSRY